MPDVHAQRSEDSSGSQGAIPREVARARQRRLYASFWSNEAYRNDPRPEFPEKPLAGLLRGKDAYLERVGADWRAIELGAAVARDELRAARRRGALLRDRDDRCTARRRELLHQAVQAAWPDPADTPAAGGPRDTANNYGERGLDDAGRARRAELWKARRWLWGNSTVDRARACGRNPVVGSVSVGLDEKGCAHVVGTQSCGSIWLCPVCASKIDAERADELREALENHAADGGTTLFLTLTMRHDREQALDELWDALGKAWQAATGGSRAARDRWAEVGKVAWVRRVETTHGANGWHVHLHALVFVKIDPDDELLERLRSALYRAWSARLVRDGLAAPSEDRAIELRPVRDVSRDLAAYMAKGYGESWSPARELAAGAAKAGLGPNRTPFEILASLVASGKGPGYTVEDDDVHDCDARLWREWESASAGRKAMTWSRGGRDRVLPDRPEFDDNALSDWTGVQCVVQTVDAQTWRCIWRANLVVAWMESAELPSEDRAAACRAVVRAASCRAGPRRRRRDPPRA